jgi:hypothetical protein
MSTSNTPNAVQQHPAQTPAEVWQVRSVAPNGDQRIVHSYYTEDDARRAIGMMQNATGRRYMTVKVPNRQAAHWGIKPQHKGKKS